MVETVWVMTSWCDGADGENVNGVYDDFEIAADAAIKTIKEIEADLKVHTEYETAIETAFCDGMATYRLCTKLGDNPFYPSDVIELRRYNINTIRR